MPRKLPLKIHHTEGTEFQFFTGDDGTPKNTLPLRHSLQQGDPQAPFITVFIMRASIWSLKLIVCTGHIIAYF